jgi:hypothetical protein
MRGAVLRLRRYPRGTWLLAMIMVCCVGAFLCLLPIALDVSAVLTTPHPLSPVQGVNQGYLAVSQEEAGDADERPVNADLLSVLLFVVCFGTIVGRLLAYGREQRAFRFVGLDHCPTFGTVLKDRSFLGVFQL